MTVMNAVIRKTNAVIREMNRRRLERRRDRLEMKRSASPMQRRVSPTAGHRGRTHVGTRDIRAIPAPGDWAEWPMASMSEETSLCDASMTSGMDHEHHGMR